MKSFTDRLNDKRTQERANFNQTEAATRKHKRIIEKRKKSY